MFDAAQVFGFRLDDSDMAALSLLHDGRHVSWDPTHVEWANLQENHLFRWAWKNSLVCALQITGTKMALHLKVIMYIMKDDLKEFQCLG